MIIEVQNLHRRYRIDSSQSIDISIPFQFNGNQPNFYDVQPGKMMPLKTGDTSWSVAQGAGCNVPEISMNIHCSGTHTESVGHLLKDPGDVGNIVKDSFLPAVLITVSPVNFEDCNESYHCTVEMNEKIILKHAIKDQVEKWSDTQPTALVIRTIPNNDNKKSLRFNDSPPPFFTNDALQYITQLGIHHLIVDIPSVDRMSDDGVLGNHRIFWGDGKNPQCDVDSDSKKTITEMAYIPNSAEDGAYFVNIQIPHFVCDAAPSRPLLFPILK